MGRTTHWLFSMGSKFPKNSQYYVAKSTRYELSVPFTMGRRNRKDYSENPDCGLKKKERERKRKKEKERKKKTPVKTPQTSPSVVLYFQNKEFKLERYPNNSLSTFFTRFLPFHLMRPPFFFGGPEWLKGVVVLDAIDRPAGRPLSTAGIRWALFKHE